MFLEYLRSDQRGVVFRLGRPTRVVGPGLVITIPALEHLAVVERGEALPGWEGYGKEELENKIISLVLDSPDLDTAKKCRGSPIILKGIVFVVGAFLAVKAGIMIFREIRDTIAGRTAPFDLVLFLIIILGMTLSVIVSTLRLMRWRTRHQLEDISVEEDTVDKTKTRNRGRWTRIVMSGGILLLCIFFYTGRGHGNSHDNSGHGWRTGRWAPTSVSVPRWNLSPVPRPYRLVF